MARLRAVFLVMLVACSSPAPDGPARAQPSQPADDGDATEAARRSLVEALRLEGIRDERVLAAIGRVPRHRFVPASWRSMAYVDTALPIGHDQTISQPVVVATMTSLASLQPPCRVLEVGTGSGYQAAVIAEMGCEVWSIEIVAPLAREAEALLRELGYGDRVHVRAGDGYAGWPEHAPFDAIVVTAAPPEIPDPLPAQLRVGGRLVAPVGGGDVQRLVVLTRTESGFTRSADTSVRFVPMTGEAQRR